MPLNENEIGHVLSCSPSAIVVEIHSLSSFESNKDRLQIGQYLRIAQGNNDFVIATIKNVTGKNEKSPDGSLKWTFLIECQALGTLVDGEVFDRGSMLLPVPTEAVYVADKSTFDKMFASNEQFNLVFGKLSMNRDVELRINGDRFFSKHIAVVGSTGSGKSCTVAKMLQEVVGINRSANRCRGSQNNSHIVIFDIHAEYEVAFRLPPEQEFTLNVLAIDNMKLPYWLMNAEELESLFIESNEQNSHNQVSQFRQAVILNKERHNTSIS